MNEALKKSLLIEAGDELKFSAKVSAGKMV